MAQPQRVQKSIDRTPYRSCYLVAILGIALFAAGAYVLTQIGGTFKRALFVKTPSIEVPGGGSEALENAKQKAQESVNSAASKAEEAAQRELEKQKEAATQAAREAAEQEAQKQLDAFKNSL
jgi:biopolymer transport protein ExbB/TolQ